jgi:hypothetical protein
MLEKTSTIRNVSEAYTRKEYAHVVDVLTNVLNNDNVLPLDAVCEHELMIIRYYEY